MSGSKSMQTAKHGTQKSASTDFEGITRADILKEVRAVLDANHFTPEQTDIFESLGYVNAQQLIAVVLNLVKEASVGSQTKPSPSRVSVAIPCDESFKTITSACDPEFFLPFKDTFKDTTIPEFWQHFRGPLLAAPNGQIGCASCSVVGCFSANGSSLLCPKRSQYGDAKKAQEQGCFFIIRSRIAEHTVEKQEEIQTYNDAKNSKGLKKTSALAKEILAKRAKLDD